MYVFGSGQCGWRGSEWMRGFDLGFTIPVGTGRVGRVSVFWLRWCGWFRWGVGLDQGHEGWGGVMSASLDSLCR